MNGSTTPVLKSAPVIKRHPKNPVLAKEHIPYPSTLVFNAGVCKYQGKYVMIFRNDVGRWNDSKFDGTNCGLATSKDGVTWDVHPQPVFKLESDEILRGYDPRLTVVDGQVYMCFAVDTKHGIRGGIARTDD